MKPYHTQLKIYCVLLTDSFQKPGAGHSTVGRRDMHIQHRSLALHTPKYLALTESNHISSSSIHPGNNFKTVNVVEIVTKNIVTTATATAIKIFTKSQENAVTITTVTLATLTHTSVHSTTVTTTVWEPCHQFTTLCYTHYHITTAPMSPVATDWFTVLPVTLIMTTYKTCPPKTVPENWYDL
ncbi:hypothetical protein OTU49_012374 [Cherax quadricarinatus]|uniref:Uncharacterized protein n=1 Tax=Cherax quadricarinatus TaxID=27406 RepID=A0AAW0YQ64_CHEQU